MSSRSFLQRLAPLAFASLLFACGSDGAGDNTDDPVVKKDAGIKKRDAGKKTSEDDDEPSDEVEDEEDEDSSPVDAGIRKGGKVEITGDSEDIACEKNEDCPADELSGSVGCCDQPTKVCFIADTAKCPAPPGRGISQPAYN